MAREDEIIKLLDTHRKYLQALRVTQAQMGVSTPPHTVVEIQEYEAKIQKLEQELADLRNKQRSEEKEPKPNSWIERPRQRVGQTPRPLLWLVVMGIVSIIGIIVSIISPPPKPASPTNSNTCLPWPEPVRIAIAQLKHCSADNRTDLLEKWTNNTKSISSPLDQSFETSAAARAQTGYDIVVWGACSQSLADQSTLNYELITSRKPDEIYEPPTISLTGALDAQSQMGTALVDYQYGDYVVAADSFKNIPATIAEAKLLASNSLLFAGQYNAAIDAYSEISRSLNPDWAAVYNNLGVARFNRELLAQEGFPQAGQDNFDQAIRLAQQQGDRDLELLARVNNSFLLLQAEKFSDAKTNCQLAEAINAQSALPHICMASYHYFRGFSKEEPMQLLQIRESLDEAAKYDDVPAIQFYLRGLWYAQKKQKPETVENLTNFIGAMKDRACLYYDRENIRNAQALINARSP